MAANAATDRARWLVERRQYLGGSDVAAICGIGTYKPIDVYMEKLGLKKDDGSTNGIAQFGLDFEPILFDKYAQMTGAKLRRCGVVRHKKYRFLAGNPDRMILNTNDLLEGKTFGFRAADEWGEPNTDQVPLKHRCQAQWYLMLTGCDVCRFIAFRRETCEYSFYAVEAHRENQEKLLFWAIKFWENHIEKKIPPQIDSSASYTGDLVSEHPVHKGETVLATEAEDDLVLQAQMQSATLKAAKDDADLTKNKIRALIGEAPSLVSIHGTVVYKQTKSGSRPLRLPK